MRIFTPRTQPIHNREQMLTELMRLAREDGLTPDEANTCAVYFAGILSKILSE